MKKEKRLNSLWNLTENKTKKVQEYIKNLEPRVVWKKQTVIYFEKLKDFALIQTTANKSLEVVGYNYLDEPNIFNICDNYERVRQV